MSAVFSFYEAFLKTESLAGPNLLHQQHLPGTLDGTIQPPLVMGWKPGIFAGKNATLVSHELPEQIDIFVIQGIRREINFRFWPRSPHFRKRPAATTAFFRFVRSSFSRHKRLLDFPMQGMAAQGWIVLLDFQFLRLQLFVPRGGITGGRFAFFPRFRAFNGDYFPWHRSFFLFRLLLRLVIVGFNLGHPD
jgi:hypothetical protein